jgi:hypothetical protein
MRAHASDRAPVVSIEQRRVVSACWCAGCRLHLLLLRLKLLLQCLQLLCVAIALLLGTGHLRLQCRHLRATCGVINDTATRGTVHTCACSACSCSTPRSARAFHCDT